MSRSYHTVVQHSIRQWSVFCVLAVQVLTDHLDMSLLTHLLSRFHPKADVASVNNRENYRVKIIDKMLITYDLLCYELH